jgi:DnaJ domain
VNRRKRKIPLSECAIHLDGVETPRPCDHDGCLEVGEFPAPKSKLALRSYYWFCLEHVRAYNAGWDFFRDMNQAEIEHFQRDSVTGHRPTWPLGSGFARAASRGAADPFELFADGGGFSPGAEAEARGPADPRQRRALAVLNLEPSANLQEIKMRYKQLVKRYHPDANGGDKSAEERFKSISEAYTFLLSNRAA